MMEFHKKQCGWWIFHTCELSYVHDRNCPELMDLTYVCHKCGYVEYRYCRLGWGWRRLPAYKYEKWAKSWAADAIREAELREEWAKAKYEEMAG